ncbi:MAG TPA: LysE family transporter, partial [Chitinophagaceae bacterium]|nr:LysE family transporter [Chitinophagaceae bacterium]
INLAVMHLGITHHNREVWRTIAVISLIEIPYCYFCMLGMKWFMSNTILQMIVQWTIVIALLILAGLSVKDANKKSNSSPSHSNSVVSGQQKKLLLIAIFNPFQLSAWAIWGSYFIDKNWFIWNPHSIFIFSLGAALGVLTILAIYKWIGQQLIEYLASHRQRIDYGMALLLLVLAAVQIYRNLLA